MKKSLLALLAMTMLSLSVYGQQASTPDKELDPSIEGADTEQATATAEEVGKKLKEVGQKTLEVSKKVGEAILESLEKVSFTQTLDAHDGKAELSYVTAAQGTIVDFLEYDEEEAQLTSKIGIYGVEIALNVVSNESLLAIQEAFIHSMGFELRSKFGTLSGYGVGLRTSLYEGENDQNTRVFEVVLGGLEYELHIKLTDDGRIKLLLAGGAEVGVALERTGDGLYLNSYGILGVQIGQVVIAAMVEARATGGVTLDADEEYLANAGYIQPKLQLNYIVNDDLTLQTALRYNTSNQNVSVDIGVQTNPEAIGNFFKNVFKKRN